MENEMENSFPTEELVDAPAVEAEEPKAAGKNQKTFKVALISVISTLLVVVLAAGLTFGVLVGADIIDTDDWFGDPDSYAVSERAAKRMAKKVVGTIGDVELTNGELQVYYKFNVFALQQSSYAYYVYYNYGIDLTQPLDTLIRDEATGQTWQDFVLEDALNSWHEITAMGMQGREEGFALSEKDLEYVAGIDALIDEITAQAGYATVEEMVYQDIGISATPEGLRNFMEAEHYFACYYAYLQEKLAPTQEQIDEYFAANEAALAESGITKDTSVVDVRHILIMPEGGTPSEDGTTTVYSEAEWEACRQRAQEILDAWKAGEATEESFAALAVEYSKDGNASEGGLYTDVPEGRMVTSFNDWIFNETRQYGDVDLVKTEFGYHIMFFVDREYTWSDYCAEALLTESLQYAIDSAKEKFPMEIDYDRIVLS